MVVCQCVAHWTSNGVHEELFQKAFRIERPDDLYFQANAYPEQSGGKYINPVIL